MIVDATQLDRRRANELLTAVVGPRPIALISTVDAAGRRNLAPFSFFGAFSFQPPTVAVAPGSRSGRAKDTLRNIRNSGELTINMVSRDLAQQANACGADFAPDVDEWSVCGLTPTACDAVAPPRVAESPASLECRAFQITELGDEGRRTNSLIVARVLRIRIDDEALEALEAEAPDPASLDLVGRLGGDWWCTSRDRFALARPATSDPDEVRDALAEQTEAA